MEYLIFLSRISVCFILGILIGLERQYRRKIAGIRTITLVSLGAFLFVSISELTSPNDITRVAAQVVSGIGFIGAGTILRDGFNVKGLTTASGLLTVSCIGLCVGAGFYFVAILATILTYLILSSSYLFTDKLDHFDMIELQLDTTDELSDLMVELENFAKKYELEFKQIKDVTEENSEYNSIKVICKYNNKMLTKNRIFTELASAFN